MSNAPSRLWNILGHLGSSPEAGRSPHIHQLSPTFFLERAAAIEPDAEAIYHVTADGKELRRSYAEFADRARGLAYYLVKHGLRRVGILAPNTPAFLESIYGIVAAGGVVVPVNYRLKQDDIAYIFDFAEVDSIIVDAEFESLLGVYKANHAKTRIIIDTVRKLSKDKATCWRC
jgi:acyl-CoA synthetase (AMP-forming)/AMP-acid ligase II